MGRKAVCTPNELATYAQDMLSQAEIGEILGITQQAVSALLKKPEYHAAWERARSSTKRKLRRAQIDSALEGDRTMLIWTGKQYLDQRDSPKEVEINQNVQVRYIAEWGGAAPEELPAGEEMELIEGEAEED
jgi:transposase